MMGEIGEHDGSVRIENGEFRAISSDLREVSARVRHLADAIMSMEERPLKRRLVNYLRAVTINPRDVADRLAGAADRAELNGSGG